MPPTKRCTKCGRTLPASSFNKANWLASGLRSDCKDCYSQSKRRAWAAQPKSDMAIRKAENAQLAVVGYRRCIVCQEVKDGTEEDFARVSTGSLDTTCRPSTRAKVKKWREKNPERAAVLAYAKCAARYSAKRRRTPPWLTAEHKRQIRAVYAECRRVSKETGVKHHVDHIVPLVGKTVSGLHVPWNLQIITGAENARKANKWNFSSDAVPVGINASLFPVGKNGPTL